MALSIQDNLFAIHEAFEAHALVLLAPERTSIPATLYSVAGQVMFDWMCSLKNLQPTYWLADGTESDEAVDSLDTLAQARPTTYFKLVFSASALSDAVTPTTDEDLISLVQEAKKRYCTLAPKSLLSPSDMLIENLGRWAYAMREKQRLLEEKNKLGPRSWIPASILVM